MSIELHGPAWAWVLIGIWITVVGPFLASFLREAWKDRDFWRGLWHESKDRPEGEERLRNIRERFPW